MIVKTFRWLYDISRNVSNRVKFNSSKMQSFVSSFKLIIWLLGTYHEHSSVLVSFSYQEFIIHHIVLHILLFYCGFLMLSVFDQLTKWSLVLHLKNQFIWNASCIGKLYYRICLHNRKKVKIPAKKLFNFLLVPQMRFYCGWMDLKNFIRWVS